MHKIIRIVICSVLVSAMTTLPVSASDVSVGTVGSVGASMDEAPSGNDTVVDSSISQAFSEAMAPDEKSGETSTPETIAEKTVGEAIVGSMAERSEKTKNGTELPKNSLSHALSNNFGLQMDMQQYFDKEELSRMGFDVDFGVLNDQYFASQAQIFESLEQSMSSMGQAANVMDVFTQNFGEQKLSLEQPTLPADFQPSAMLSTMNAAINKQYSDVTSQGMFANVKNSIGIGNVFGIARAGLSSDLSSNLMPVGGMLSVMGSASSAAGGAIMSEFGSLKAANVATGESLKANVVSNAYDTAMSSMDWSNSMVSPDGVNNDVMDSKASSTSLMSIGKFNANHTQSRNEYNAAVEKRKRQTEEFYNNSTGNVITTIGDGIIDSVSPEAGTSAAQSGYQPIQTPEWAADGLKQ